MLNMLCALDMQSAISVAMELQHGVAFLRVLGIVLGMLKVARHRWRVETQDQEIAIRNLGHFELEGDKDALEFHLLARA